MLAHSKSGGFGTVWPSGDLNASMAKPRSLLPVGMLLVGWLAGTYIGGPIVYGGPSAAWWDSGGGLEPTVSFQSQEGVTLEPTSFRGCWFSRGGGELRFDEHQERVSFVFDPGDGPRKMSFDPRHPARDDSWSPILTVTTAGRPGEGYPSATVTTLSPGAFRAEVPRPSPVRLPRRESLARTGFELFATVVAPVIGAGEDAAVASIPPTIRFAAWPKVAVYRATFQGCAIAPNGKEITFDDGATLVSFVARVNGKALRIAFDPREFERGGSGTRFLSVERDGSLGGYYPKATVTRVSSESLRGEKPTPLVLRRMP